MHKQTQSENPVISALPDKTAAECKRTQTVSAGKVRPKINKDRRISTVMAVIKVGTVLALYISAIINNQISTFDVKFVNKGEVVI